MTNDPAVSAITPVEEQFKCEGCGREYTRESWSTITLCGQCFHYSKLEDRIDVLTAENARLEARLAALLSSDRAVQPEAAVYERISDDGEILALVSAADVAEGLGAEIVPDTTRPYGAMQPVADELLQRMVIDRLRAEVLRLQAEKEEWIARFNKLPEIVHRAEERAALLSSDSAVYPEEVPTARMLQRIRERYNRRTNGGKYEPDSRDNDIAHLLTEVERLRRELKEADDLYEANHG